MKRTLLVVFVTVLLDLLGFGIIIPIQPFYAEHFGASPTMVTLLGGSYSLMQFLFAPFWGSLSDRFGRRPILLSSICISAIGYLTFGLAESLGGLFAARMISGFGNANLVVAQAVIADTTTPENRSRGMGMIGAAFGLGFILGPAFGGFLGQYGLAVPAYGAAALGAMNLILAIFLLPETNENKDKDAPVLWNPLRRLSGLSLGGDAGRLVVILLVLTTGFSMMEQTLGLFIENVWVHGGNAAAEAPTTEGFKRAAALTSYLLVAIGIASTIVQGGLIGRLTDRFGELRLSRVGLLMVAVTLFLHPLVGATGSFPMLFPVAILMAVGTGLCTPSVNSLLSKTAAMDAQGQRLGAGQSASALGRVLAPLTAGWLFEQSINLPFFVGGSLVLVAFFLATRLGASAESNAAE
jgi:multidrug resistance protein